MLITELIQIMYRLRYKTKLLGFENVPNCAKYNLIRNLAYSKPFKSYGDEHTPRTTWTVLTEDLSLSVLR